MYKSHTASFLSIITLTLVILASGCTFPGSNMNLSGSGGVLIENFEVDFPRIYAGENFKIEMRIRNEGLIDAMNVQPVLYNIESGTYDAELSCEISEMCRLDPTLVGIDPDSGTTGESITCIWDCKAPLNIQKGLSVTFNPSVRLYYFYKTSVVKSINLVSQNELRSIEAQGKTLPSETMSKSIGPVSLDVIVNGPIRYWEDISDGKVKFPININIQNIGGGTVFHPMSADFKDSNDWNKVLLKFRNTAENVNLLCNDQMTTEMEVDLWKGSATTLVCEVEITNLRQASAAVTKNLRFTADYGYFIDNSVQVEVVGRDTN